MTPFSAEMSVEDLTKLAGVMCASNMVDRCLVWLEGSLQVAAARNQTAWVESITHSYRDLVKKVTRSLWAFYAIPSL